MDEGQIKQGTEEWKEQRRGFITSSAAHKLMAEPKLKADKDAGNLSKEAKSYIMEVIASEISIPFELNTEAVTWGKSNEQLARHFYQIAKGYKVEDVGFIPSDIDGYGGSADGVVPVWNGIIEIKCPFKPSNHLIHCLIESVEDIPDEYYWQIVSNMYVCKADWCDFISFDPRIDNELGLFIFRINRFEEQLNEARLLLNVKKGLEYKESIKRKLKI